MTIPEGAEVFVPDPRMLLVSQYKFEIGTGFRLGKDQEGNPMWFGTFQGRVNNSDELVEFNIAMHPMDAWEMFGVVLDQFEQLNQGMSGHGGARAERRKRAAGPKRKRKR